MNEKISELISQLNGETSIVIKNLATKEELFSHNDKQVCFSASTIKIPILLELFDKHTKKEIDIYAMDNVTQENIVTGAGVIRHLTIPSTYSWMDYGILMIILSDNIATNKLIEFLGYEAINKKIKEIGMTDTILQRKMYDLKAREEGRDNFTTARDMQIILEYIYDNNNKYELATDILKRQLVNDKLPSLIEPPIVMAHKTGELEGIRHDVGIMYLKDPILVCVTTQNLKSNLEGTLFHGKLGKIIWEYLK